jgi:hypothetical protein
VEESSIDMPTEDKLLLLDIYRAENPEWSEENLPADWKFPWYFSYNYKGDWKIKYRKKLWC